MIAWLKVCGVVTGVCFMVQLIYVVGCEQCAESRGKDYNTGAAGHLVCVCVDSVAEVWYVLTPLAPARM